MSDAQPSGDQAGSPASDGIRASDSERAATVERLKSAHDEGRLTLDEFSGRIAKARDAQTRGELQAIVADLPAPTPAPSPVTTGSGAGGQMYTVKSPAWHIAPVGGWKQRGRWRLDRDINAISLLGGVDVDLTNAVFAVNEVTLTSISLLGGTEITVPRNVRVEVEGINLLGGRDILTEQPDDPGAPVFRVRAFGLVGGVKVRNS